MASLDTTYLEINVDKAEIALKKANADLDAKKINTQVQRLNLVKIS